jgi:hypothetical protein
LIARRGILEVKKYLALWVSFTVCAVFAAPRGVSGDEKNVIAAPTAVSASQQEMDIEKLRLENQKLELEVEKMKLQATLGPSAYTKPERQPTTDKRDNVEKFQAGYSDQAQSLAQQHQSETDLLVTDFVNSELWYQGTRYGIHEWEALAGNQGWKVSTILNGRDPGGHARNLYSYRNVSLLRYEGRKRGVLILKAPIGEGDFRILTPEGLSFASPPEDVRNTLKNEYFDFDAQKRNKKGISLRYIHKMKRQFADKIEISFDKNSKMTDIRYGVLDEH